MILRTVRFEFEPFELTISGEACLSRPVALLRLAQLRRGCLQLWLRSACYRRCNCARWWWPGWTRRIPTQAAAADAEGGEGGAAVEHQGVAPCVVGEPIVLDGLELGKVVDVGRRRVAARQLPSVPAPTARQCNAAGELCG
jgi:hypothetical protein